MKKKVSCLKKMLVPDNDCLLCVAKADGHYAVLEHPIEASDNVPNIHDVKYAVPTGYRNKNVRAQKLVGCS